MGRLANALYALLLGWFRALVTQLFDLFTGQGTSPLARLAANWLPLCVAILCFGLFMDLLVYLTREKPHRRLALAIRRALGLDRRDAPGAPEAEASEAPADPEAWLPLTPPEPEPLDEGAILSRAEAIPDEALPEYPGMRYAPADGETRRYAQPEETRRVPALREDAAQAKMPAPAAATIEKNDIETEQERYARELREYEEKRAAYERELAEYERQKAAYDAQQARQREQTQNTEDGGAANRRRRRGEP